MSAVTYEMNDAEIALVDEAMSNNMAALAAFTISVLVQEGTLAGLAGDHEKADKLFAIVDRMEVVEVAEELALARESLSDDIVAYTDHLDALEEQVIERAKDLGL